MKKIIVFGGSGFLGSHVSDKLSEEGHEVTIYDIKKSPWLKKNQNFILGDILNEKKINDSISQNEIVYNFAGLSDLEESYYSPIQTIKQNVLSNALILNSCKNNKIKKYIFASTVYVYSKYGGFYRTSKKSCELYIENYFDTYGQDYIILQFGTLYGPRSGKNNAFYNYISDAIKKQTITYKGSSESIRSYINVEDAARCCVEILKKQYKNKKYIITGLNEYKVSETFKLIEDILGKKIKILYKKPKLKSHYERSPYFYNEEKPIIFSMNTKIDLGYGILSLIKDISNNN